MMRLTCFTIFLALAAPSSLAFDPIVDIDKRHNETKAMARSIWELSELGYLETKTTRLMQEALHLEGFEIETGIADIPTAFLAKWGEDGPIIGILAEMDALPGFSQKAMPEKQSRAGQTSGHACGHHLFGSASLSAAIAIKRWLEATDQSGQIWLYGTPAEEGGSGKVYMVRDGAFDGVDIVLHWHPADENTADIATTNANRSAKFRFSGQSTHAAAAPHRGRSALDGVEAMNMMTNLMREHIPSESRMHYVITAGGVAPNVVPDFAEVYYYVRNPDPEILKDIWARVENAARGAALGTGTSVDWEIIHGNRNMLPNTALQTLIHQELSHHVAALKPDPKLDAFANEMRKSFSGKLPPMRKALSVKPISHFRSAGSTDVADVSWVAPTGGFRTATWVPGTSAHSWQAVAAGGHEYGYRGMNTAAKTLTSTAQKLYQSPDLIAKAKAELEESRGADFVYEPLLGDRAPPLDYRLDAALIAIRKSIAASAPYFANSDCHRR